MKRSMTLRSHLITALAATILPLLVIASVALIVIAQTQESVTERGLRETARALALTVDGMFETSIAALSVLARSPHLESGDLAAFYEHAAAVRRPEWKAVFLLDATGQELLTLLRPFGTPLPNLSADPDVQHALRFGLPYVSDLVVGQVSGASVVRVLVPARRGHGVAYVLAASLSPEVLSGLLPHGTGVLATVLDRKDRVVAQNADVARWAGELDRSDFIHRTRGLADGFFVSAPLGGERYYVAFARVRGEDFVVAVGVPASAITSGRSLWLVGLGIGLALVAGVALAGVLTRRVARPIGDLAGAARALRDGSAPPTLSPSGIREVDVVVEAFNDAAAALAAQASDRERRLRAEAERLKAEATAAEADAANRAKDEFLAMLGHELRNPLGTIRNAVEVLGRAHHDDARATRAREILGRQLAQLGKLVDDLLDVGRVAAGKIVVHREPLDLGALVARAVTGLETARALDGRRVDTRLQPLWVSADEVRLEQVVNNLLLNALKYTEENDRIEVSLHREGDDAVLAVSDSGAGIPPEMLPRIFDLFVQGERPPDRRDGGLGIGLTLARRLVELHGGTIQASSEGRGRGATFTVRLPLAEPSPEPQDDRSPPAPRPRRRVLVVEDNDDGREMLAAMLRAKGHEVREAADGPGAVDAILAHAPDVAIIDIGLPGFDGYEVARRVLDHLAPGRCRLVALTAYGQPQDQQRSLDAGFQAHLIKPVDPLRLDEVMASA